MDLLLGISNGNLAITAVITGLGLVFAALLIARSAVFPPVAIR